MLLEILERDWVERGEVEKKVGGRDAAGESGRKGALVVKYLPETMGGAGMRRVVRAILANGTGRMAKEWKEVWTGEAAPPVVQTDDSVDDNDADGEKKIDLLDTTGKRGEKPKLTPGKGKEKYMGTDGEDYLEKLDHYWSDILETSEDELLEGETIFVGSHVSHKPSERLMNPATSWGGMEAVLLRKRLILIVI